jgi:predicted Fe-Mo cluster-binding NifX family protein
MRVAIATFGSEVSPRFCGARRVLVAEVDGGRVTNRAAVSLDDYGLTARIRLLGSLGVRLLVCGAFDRAFLAEAERAGLHVVARIDGSVEAALGAVAAGRLGPGRCRAGCWCGASRAGRARGSSKRHSGGGREV